MVGLLVKTELVWTRNEVIMVQFEVLVQHFPRQTEQKHENPLDSWSVDKDFHLRPYQYKSKVLPMQLYDLVNITSVATGRLILKQYPRLMPSNFLLTFQSSLLFCLNVFLNAFHGFSSHFYPCLWQSWVSTASMILIPIFISY